MTGAEQGYLLLTSHLGDPQRKCLTVPQLRDLFQRMQNASREDPERDLTVRDIVGLGYRQEFAQRIVSLLSDRQRLQWYIDRGREKLCVPVTRSSPQYPLQLIQRLRAEAPGSLWAKGDLSLLDRPMIALVGSRDLRRENREFAVRAGFEAAQQGCVLLSGNARGADRTAQEACLAAGGSVICVVADELVSQPYHDRVLYLSEDGYDLPFSSQRALLRNRVIHSMGLLTLVAQCTLGKGGTWDGTLKNLEAGWSNVFCFRDESAASVELAQRGASLISLPDLRCFSKLSAQEASIFDQC